MGLIGLQEYIDKHGRHFTEKLAIDILKDTGQYKKKKGYIDRVFNKKVWYNVNDSSIGDILFMINTSNTKDVINYLGDYNMKGKVFNTFILASKFTNTDFDFTLYV